MQNDHSFGWEKPGDLYDFFFTGKIFRIERAGNEYAAGIFQLVIKIRSIFSEWKNQRLYENPTSGLNNDE